MNKVLINVGHSEWDSGAVSVDGTSEFRFNSVLAKDLKKELENEGYTVEIVNQGKSYRNLANLINRAGGEICVSLHFNASPPAAHGTEVLYWHSSKGGKSLASILQDNIVEALGTRSRGLKSIKKGNRGAPLLRGTSMVCVLVEPAFGTNREDWGRLQNGYSRYVKALAEGIDRYMKEEAIRSTGLFG